MSRKPIELTAAYKEFYDVAKLMNKSEISSNIVTLTRYRSLIIPAYNKFVKFVADNYTSAKQSDQYLLDDSLARARGILIKCLDNLQVQYTLPNDIYKIISESDVSEIQIPQIESKNDQSNSSETPQPVATTSTASNTERNTSNVVELFKKNENEKSNEKENFEKRDADVIAQVDVNPEAKKGALQLNIETKEIDLSGKDNFLESNVNERTARTSEEEFEDEENLDSRRNSDSENSSARFEDEENLDSRENSDSEDSSVIMPMDAIQLFNAVNRQFTGSYSGDPLGLTAFIDGIEILEDFADTPALKNSLLKFLKSKLDGRAREFISNDVVSIRDFKSILRANIVPENSKVIEGRILSLRYAYSKQEDFASKAEQLADSLRRTLIIEGMTSAKANEISIEKTVELCRKSTTSDLVKAVLASGNFNSPKEVIAKLIVESDTHVKEQQILRCQKVNGRNSSMAFGNGSRPNGRGGSARGRYGTGNNHRGQNGNRRFAPRGRRYQQNNYTGNSNGSGNAYNSNNSNNYANRGNWRRDNTNGSNVRMAQTNENSQEADLGFRTPRQFQ